MDCFAPLAMTAETYSSFSTCRSVRKQLHPQVARSQSWPTPPSTAAGTVPNSAAVIPLFELAELVGGVDKQEFTAPTPAAHVVGRC